MALHKRAREAYMKLPLLKRLMTRFTYGRLSLESREFFFGSSVAVLRSLDAQLANRTVRLIDKKVDDDSPQRSPFHDAPLQLPGLRVSRSCLSWQLEP